MHHLNVNNVELETLPPWSCFRFDLVFYCIFDWLWESLSIQSIKIQTYSSYFQPCYSSHSTYHILIIMSVSHSSVLKFISCKLMVKSSCKKWPRIRFVWYSLIYHTMLQQLAIDSKKAKAATNHPLKYNICSTSNFWFPNTFGFLLNSSPLLPDWGHCWGCIFHDRNW